METPDVKVHRSASYLADLAKDDFDLLLIMCALFLISATLYMLKNAVSKGSVRVERFDRTQEENTDAMIDTANEIRGLRTDIQGLRSDLKGYQNANN